MSEETATQEVSDPVDSLPDQQLDFGSALDAAFAALNDPEPEPEPEPASEPDPTPEPEPEPVSESEPVAETQTDESEEALGDFDPTDQLDADVGDDWTPKAASRFKQLKAELKASNDELNALRQKMSENESKVTELSGELQASDIEEMQKKLEEYEQEKMFTDLEETAAYKAAITEPLDRLLETAKEISEKYEIDPDELVDALALQDQTEQDERLAQLMDDTSDRDRARIFRVIEDLGPILEKRVSMMENAQQALNEANLASEREMELQAAERARERQNAAKNVVARVQQKLPFLSGIEGLDMAAIQEKAAEVDPSVIHPVDYTYNSVSAQILPSIVKEYASLRKEVDVLTDRLSQYEDAEPSVAGSSSSQAPIDDDASFSERIERAFSASL